MIAIPPSERVTVREAAELVDVNESTVRRWCDKFKIGVKPIAGGWEAPGWRVSLPAVRMIAAEDWDSLNMFLKGERTDPQVRQYIPH